MNHFQLFFRISWLTLAIMLLTSQVVSRAIPTQQATSLPTVKATIPSTPSIMSSPKPGEWDSGRAQIKIPSGLDVTFEITFVVSDDKKQVEKFTIYTFYGSSADSSREMVPHPITDGAFAFPSFIGARVQVRGNFVSADKLEGTLRFYRGDLLLELLSPFPDIRWSAQPPLVQSTAVTTTVATNTATSKANE